MAVGHFDFDVVTRLETDAVGAPGQRRFRLVVANEQGTAVLWLEKEQLQALSLAVDQVLTQLKPLWSRTAKPAAATESSGFDGQATVEFRVGRLGLGYDEERERYVLVAHDIEAEHDDVPNLRCLATRTQLNHLSDSIGALASAGRPRCPLCGTPLGDGPHFCPGSNGHSHAH